MKRSEYTVIHEAITLMAAMMGLASHVLIDNVWRPIKLP